MLAAASVNNKTYEYIVVGSGPGGGPLASNLARAGHSVLLLEAGYVGSTYELLVNLALTLYLLYKAMTKPRTSMYRSGLTLMLPAMTQRHGGTYPIP
jgi:choline dehydrogenase-like flavoprotein